MSADLWVAVIIAVVGLAGGSGGFVAWYKARSHHDSSDRDALGRAHEAGWDKASTKYEADLTTLRTELAAERTERVADFKALRDVLGRHHRAIHRLVKLVPVERMPEALSIISELEIVPYTLDSDTGG